MGWLLLIATTVIAAVGGLYLIASVIAQLRAALPL